MMNNAATADLTQLSSVLNLAGQKAQVAVAAAIRGAAYEVQQQAQANAPKKTGTLASSITVSFDGPMHAEIGPQVPYGVFQEYGTKGPYTIKPKRPGGYLHFTVNGTHVVTRQVTHPGLQPNPYMRPAAEQVIGALVEKTGGIGVSLVVNPGAS